MRVENGPPIRVSQEAMRALMAYSWPGNVRELENAVERAGAFRGVRGQIELGDLPPEVAAMPVEASTPGLTLPDGGLDLEAVISNIERELIELAMERTKRNKNRAAQLLHLKRTTLVEKIKRLNR